MMDFTFPNFLFIALGSIVLGFAGAWVVAKYGFKLKLVDIPNDRSSHTVPTPRGGGMGIPFAVGVAAFLVIQSYYVMVGLALVLSFFTFIDDRKGLPVKVRFGFQLLSALVFVVVCRAGFLRVVNREWGGVVMAAVVLFVVLFITASTNFFNFMDGINGISGFMAVVSFGLLGGYYLYYGVGEGLIVISVTVVFSSVGFLFMNFPKGRVFMGDVGSIFIGNLFIFVVIYQVGGVKEFLLLTLFQGTMYLDCVSTLILRLVRGENILQAHKKHLYQRLVHGVGWSHTRVTLLFSLVQFLVGIGAIFLYKYHVLYLAGLWLFLIIVYWVIRLLIPPATGPRENS